MMNFSMSFDPGSLDELVRLAGFPALMDAEIVSMLAATGTLLVTAAQANTWEVFEHPTGQLADSITFSVVSPSEIALEVGVPYGRRREYGFSGMTDSLGRYFADDPAKPYLAPAIEESRELIRAILESGVRTALGGLI